MAKLDLASVVGLVTGNEAARAKIAGGLLQVQGAIQRKLEVAGKPLGSVFGSEMFKSLSKGAVAGESQAVDTLAQEQTGYTVSGILNAAKGFGVVAVALVVFGVAWFIGRRNK